MPETESNEIILRGIGGSPGICIGKAYLVDREGVDVVQRYAVDGKDLAREKKRFKAAVQKAKEELHHIIKSTPEEFQQHADILETHVVLLKDKMLYARAIEIIENEKINAEWALKKSVSGLKRMFRDMTDPYLRQRAEDIVHVSDRILRNLVGARQVDIRSINKRVILVAHDLSPAETSQIQLERVMGFVTDRGGKASHTSIIARTLEIPAVLGVGEATHRIRNDEIIIVDGSEGSVVLHPTEETLVEYQERQVQFEAFRQVISRDSHLPAKTQDGIQIDVMGNIELPEEVVSVLDHGGEGIGLYRTEFGYLSRSQFPIEEELFDKYKDVVEVMAPRPVTIRTLDINGDKALNYAAQRPEENPALGLRAIRYCLKRQDIFQTQLRAILRAAAYGHVRILLPMISGVDELREARRNITEAAAALEKEGAVHNAGVAVGIMIEVPSAVVLADYLAEEADFFSIGTNDLIQYSLAIDRGNQEVAHLFNPLHPALLRMIRQVTETARAHGIETYMCGEMAADPVHVPILLALGLDELSMNPQSIPAVKRVIRSLSAEKCKPFLELALQQRTAQDVMNLLRRTYGEIFAENLYGQG